jgi:uncharacterized protein (DUF2235 family)
MAVLGRVCSREPVWEGIVAKNVLIFSDGTGQGASMPKEESSNVWQLYEATRNVDAPRQVAFYDPGLGAPDKEHQSPWAYIHNLASRATGLGISRNIKHCYEALIRLYEAPDDRIFLFGFSRGAYTVRSLGGVLSLCGIPRRGRSGTDVRSDAKARSAIVEEAVETVYKHYGNDDKTKKERERLGQEFAARYDSVMATPYFIGVWETVRALGVPGSSGLLFWRHRFHNASLNPKVRCARQALSIDENRQVFKPELWDETDEDRSTGRIKQLWFAGVHADVGGGYREYGLSDLALDWMVREAIACEYPLLVDAPKLELKPAYDGEQHDERTGWGWLWSEGTREALAPADFYQDVEKRFRLTDVLCLTRRTPYRPRALQETTVFKRFYSSLK